MDALILKLPRFFWNPKVVTAVIEPSLFLAVQTYAPESFSAKFSILNVPFLLEVLPFGKAVNARAHVTTDGGWLKASQVTVAVVPSSIRIKRSGILISWGATVKKKEKYTQIEIKHKDILHLKGS